MPRWLILAVFCLLPLTATAADDPKKEPPDRDKLLKATPEEFLKLFDKNNDGTLDKDEMPPALAQVFPKADRDGNGKLDAKEIAEMLKVLRDRAGDKPPTGDKPPAGGGDPDKVVAGFLEKMDANKDGKLSKDEVKGPLADNFARVDKNGDGFLDKEELKAIADKLAGAPPGPGGRPDPAAILERLDTNKDGKISKDEAKGPLADNFAALDKNSDGFLDKDELKAAAEKLGPPPGPGGKPDPAKILEQLDTNKDGKISKDEAKGPLAENFARVDKNGDGFIDKDELKAFTDRLPPGPGGQPAPKGPEFDPLDKDADGRLTKEELKGSPLADKFDEIDANKDGKIDRKEFDAFTKKR